MSQPEVERRAPDAPAPVRRPVSRRPASALPERLSRHLVLYGVVLVVLQLAFRGWALAGSWFYFDDIAFMSRAMNEPLDASYLLESYGGHLMPGGFLTAWLLTKVAVYSWAPWAAVLLVLQALAGFGMLRLLVSLFGRRPLVLALLAGYLAYVFTLSAGIWFAAGINQLPMQVALVFGLHAHVEYLRHRRIRSLVWAIAWTLAGLVFYEKTLLLLGIYAIVAFGWFCTGGTHRPAPGTSGRTTAPACSRTARWASATWRSTSSTASTSPPATRTPSRGARSPTTWSAPPCCPA